MGNQIDGPSTALLGTLKRLGLLKKTLVVIDGEFGRTTTLHLLGLTTRS